jgi:hypothetical protein
MNWRRAGGARNKPVRCISCSPARTPPRPISYQPGLAPAKSGDLATAILDRLPYHCEVIAINGPSNRLKNRLAAVETEVSATG